MRYSFHLVIDGTRAVAFAKLAQACTLSTDTARCWATAPKVLGDGAPQQPS